MTSEHSSRKRPRDDDHGNEKDGPPSSSPLGDDGASEQQEQEVKRRRLGTVTYGLGAFAGLVGKAFRATASVFGRTGGRQQLRWVCG